MQHTSPLQRFLKRVPPVLRSAPAVIVLIAVILITGLLFTEARTGFFLSGDSTRMYEPAEMPDESGTYGPARMPEREQESSRSSAMAHSAARASSSGKARKTTVHGVSRR